MNQKYRFTDKCLEVLNDRGYLCIRSNATSVEQLAKENLIETMQGDLNKKKNELFSLQIFLDDSKWLCKFWNKLMIGFWALSGVMLLLGGLVLSNISSTVPVALLLTVMPLIGSLAEASHKKKLTEELSQKKESYALLEKIILEEEKKEKSKVSFAMKSEEFQKVPTDPNLSIYQNFSHSYDFYQQHRNALHHALKNGTLDAYCRKHFSGDPEVLTTITSLGPNPDVLAKGYTYCKQKKY